MQIVALDGTKLIVLMLAGGAFALAGLWLMFRPQPEGEAARIELFGLKVQASSAALLVFLIGAGFLSVPIFVPEKPAPVGPNDEHADEGHGGEAQREGQRRPDRIEIETEEAEPNDTIASANIVSIGSVIRGELTRGDADFFAVDIPDATRGQIVAAIYVTDTGARVQLLDDAGTPLTYNIASPGGSTSVESRIERSRYFVAVRNERATPGSYTLTIAVREQ